ncbi:hypothetical protein BGW42_007766, partial [Actinomortierella wolfii]
KLGIQPKEEQLDVADCIARKKDCILIADCGWGKSLAFFIPLILWSDRSMLIIAPLKAIMHQHKS